MNKKTKDKARRSVSQQAQVACRISEGAHRKLIAIANKERRSIGAQAGIYLEKVLQGS